MKTTICDKCKLECEIVHIEQPTSSEFWGTTELSYETYLYSECCGAEISEIEEEE